MPLKNPNERVICPDCGDEYSRSQRSWHIKTKCNVSNIDAIREGHIDKNIDKDYGYLENEDDTDEEINNHKEVKIYNAGNNYQSNLRQYQPPIHQKRQSFIPTINQNTLNEMKKFEQTIVQLVDKVNYHSDDLNKLKLSNNSLVLDVKAMKEELTRQHRGVVRASNEYHKGGHRKDKIKEVVRKSYRHATGGSDVNVSNALKSLEKVTGALQSSIERTNDRLNGLILRMDTLEADQESNNIRIKGIEDDNKGIHLDINRHGGKIQNQDKVLNKLDEKINTIEDKISKIPNPEEIINMMKEFLRKEGYNINKIVKEPKNNISSKKVKDEDKTLKEKDFESDIKEWLDNVGLRKGEITQKGVKELKTIFDKYASMGHHVEMTSYIEKLPNKLTRGPVNLKKVEARKALLIFKKNYEVK